MAETLGGLTPSQISRFNDLLGWYENTGRYLVPPPNRTTQRREPPPYFLAKANGTINTSTGGPAILWSSTTNSTSAEASLGTSETVYPWAGATAESGDEIHVWRHWRSGRLYFSDGGGAAGTDTYGWMAWGNSAVLESALGTTQQTLGSSDVVLTWEDGQEPSRASADVGVELSTANNYQINFTKAGTYKVDVVSSYELSESGGGVFPYNAEGRVSVTRSTDKASSTVYAGLNGMFDFRFSVTATTDSNDGGNPSQTITLSGIVLATSDHAMRVESDTVGNPSTDFTLDVTRHTITVQNLANSETYATS